jgi:hypothetical protein
MTPVSFDDGHSTLTRTFRVCEVRAVLPQRLATGFDRLSSADFELPYFILFNRGNIMKATTVLSTAILFLLPAAIVPAYAQEHEQEKRPEQKQQQQAKPAQQQAKPAKQTQQAQHQEQAKPAQQPQRAAGREQAKPVQQQPQRAASREPAKAVQQPQRGQEQQRASRAEPAAGHGRIPDDRFRASFGRGHTFHVNRSEFANGSGRFQYGGFWFNVVQPWPVGWLYTDSVYVDYLNGGYFLCDPVHPGVYISVNIG